MAFTTWLLAFSLLLIIFQVPSSLEQETYPALEAVDDAAIKALQTKIRYQFKDQLLLMRATTHASYSFDNNGALSILGLSVIRAAISLHYILTSSSTAKEDLNSEVVEYSNCTALSQDALDLKLHELIRVAPKVNPKEKVILCGCYNALFGAIGVDAKDLNVAKEKLWLRHGWNSPKIMQKQATRKPSFGRVQ